MPEEFTAEIRFIANGQEIVIKIPPEGVTLHLIHYGRKRKSSVQTATTYRLNLKETGICL